MCPVQCVPYNVSRTMCPVFSVPYTVFRALCHVLCVLYNELCTLCPVIRVLYSVSCALCPVHYGLYNESCTLFLPLGARLDHVVREVPAQLHLLLSGKVCFLKSLSPCLKTLSLLLIIPFLLSIMLLLLLRLILLLLVLLLILLIPAHSFPNAHVPDLYTILLPPLRHAIFLFPVPGPVPCYIHAPRFLSCSLLSSSYLFQLPPIFLLHIPDFVPCYLVAPLFLVLLPAFFLLLVPSSSPAPFYLFLVLLPDIFLLSVPGPAPGYLSDPCTWSRSLLTTASNIVKSPGKDIRLPAPGLVVKRICLRSP